MSGGDLDLIVLATATPDQTFPSTAVKVQAQLGMKRGAAFDVQAVCSGFIFALAVADNALRLGQARTALVIGAETFSRILDWQDRGTCVLFGDGAGALVLQAVAGETATRGILSTHLHSDGRQHDILYVDGGPSSTGTAGCLRMEGREVFRQAVTHLTEAVDEALAANGLHRGRHRLARAAPGQYANHRGGRPQARAGRRQDGPDDRAARQHLGGIDPAGARRGRRRRPHPARTSGADGGAGRRSDLGRQRRPLVKRESVGHSDAASHNTLEFDEIFRARLTLHEGREGVMAGHTVTRAQLTEAVYQEVGLSRNESAELVESVIAEISEALERGEMVKISSFGSFAVRHKGQRVGRNPKDRPGGPDQSAPGSGVSRLACAEAPDQRRPEPVRPRL